MSLVRIPLWLCGGFILAMFQQRCPQCKHKMTLHKKIDGKFVD
jgi:hypothetical protein